MAAVELLNTTLLADANLENYYRFESNSNDSSSKGRNLTVSGTVSYNSGKFGNCASANYNASNYISGSTFNPGSGNFTFGCWFKKNGAPTTDYSPTILSIGGFGHRLCLTASKTSGYAYFQTYDGSSTDLASTTNICDNTYKFVVMTRSGTNLYIYVNGSQVATTSGTARNVSTTTFVVGGHLAGADDVIGQADIDDVFVFSRALSGTEVSDLYSGALLLPSGGSPLLFGGGVSIG